MQASAYKPRSGEKLYSNRLKVGYLKLMDERAGKAMRPWPVMAWIG
jgi:hypothetical protein